jgi:hypothetical protein
MRARNAAEYHESCDRLEAMAYMVPDIDHLNWVCEEEKHAKNEKTELDH